MPVIPIISGDGKMVNKMTDEMIDRNEGPMEYNLLFRTHGIRIGTTPADNIERSGKIIEVDLFLGSEGTISEDLIQFLSRVERLEDMGFIFTMEQEFSLTCSKYADDHDFDSEFTRVRRTLISSSEEDI